MPEPSPTAPTPSRWNFLPILVALLAVLFLVAHFDLKPVLGDEGVLAMDGWRISMGQIPNRDFFQFIPPLAGAIQAGFLGLLGPTVLALRIPGLMCGLLLLFALALASSQILISPLARAVALAVLVPFGAGVWPFASHHWWVDIFLLFALAFLFGAEAGRSPLARSIAAGVALGAATLTLQDQGLYALLGTLALVLPFLGPGLRGKCTAGVLAGFSALVLPVFGILLGLVGPARLWEDFVLFPLHGYHGAVGNRVNLARGLAQILGQWDPEALRVAPLYTSLIALASMVVFALPLLAAASLVAAWRNRWLPATRLALLAVFCAAFLGAAFHRWSLMNLIWAASLPAVAAVLALDRGLLSPEVRRRRLSAGICIGILVVFCGFGILRIGAARPSRTHTVLTPAGSYRTFNPYEAADLQSFCDAVSATVPAGEPAFCFGFCPLLSFLTGHPNPTAFNFLITPRYNGPEHISRWIREIETKSVRWGFGLNTAPDPADPADTYLRDHFDPAWANARFVLWRRHEPPR